MSGAIYPSFPQETVPIIKQTETEEFGAVAGGGMIKPQGIPNCPPGLEYLTKIDHLIVQQKNTCLGFQTKFTIMNSSGESIYFGVEDGDSLVMCSGSMIEMQIVDNFNREIIHLYRPTECDRCFSCSRQSMEVSLPPDRMIGTVLEAFNIGYPLLKIKDPRGDTVLRIEGPRCFASNIGGDINYKIKSIDRSVQVGKISKKWSGFLTEMFSNTHYFDVTFPMNLDVRMKAVILGACFQIDAMFFNDKTIGRS